jgi:tRNA (guanosine-2'-O-)-methyltransferase
MINKYLEHTQVPDHLIKTDKRMEKLADAALLRQNDLTVVLENIHDPHNISACIRSCDAVGISTIHVINTIAPKPYRRLGKKTSAGSVKWVKTRKWKSVKECYDLLHSQGYKIYTTALGEKSQDLYELDLTQKTAMVFGNEHDGISDEALELSDANYVIPQMGMISSLNISVACAVSLFEAMRQKRQVGHYDPANRDIKELEANYLDILDR